MAPYLQKHSGVPETEIATLKRAFFRRASGGVDGGVNPLGDTTANCCPSLGLKPSHTHAKQRF